MGGVTPVCLILCAGKATRFCGIEKQLLPIPGRRSHGETFLSRIIRQIRQRGGEPFVVANRLTIQEAAARYSTRTIDPGVTKYTTETFALTVHKWRDRTHVFLGDVCYSRAVMDWVFGFNGPMGVWGNEEEIYALSFRRTIWQDICNACETVLLNADLDLDDPGAGKLRRFYQAFCGLTFGSNLEREPRTVLQYVVPGKDYTMDVDTPREYALFKEFIEWSLDDV